MHFAESMAGEQCDFHSANQLSTSQMRAIGIEGNRPPSQLVELARVYAAPDASTGRARPEHTIVLVSTTWEPIPISFLGAQLKEITLVPAYVYGEAPAIQAHETALPALSEDPELFAGAEVVVEEVDR